MTLPVVTVPAIVLAPQFPTNADRASGGWNAKAYAWANGENAMATRTREIAVAANANAAVANQAASEAVTTAANAVSQTTAIKDAAVSQTTAIKDAAVSQTTAIKDAAVSQTTAIKDAATQSAAQASSSAAAAAASANFAGDWAGLTGALTIGASTYHSGKFWVLLQSVANVTAHEPGASAVWVRSGSSIEQVAYGSRAALRTTAAVAGDLTIIDGLGLFQFASGSDEPDDDESCFSTASGRWLLHCPSWDIINDWQLPDDNDRDSRATALELSTRLGTATCAVTSVAAVSSITFTGAVLGAAIGYRVLVTPPAALGSTDADSARLSYHAYVSATNTVTVRLTNASAASANVNSAVQTAWLITAFKGL